MAQQDFKQVLLNFAEELGRQDKELMTTLRGEITTAINDLENKLVDGAPEALNTFKELAERLTQTASEAGLGERLLQKINEFKTELENKINAVKANADKVTGLETKLNALNSIDLNAAYRRGKGA